MKYLIVGLGNIGVEYDNTRHNVGFKVVDAIAASNDVVFKSDRYGSVCEVRHRGKTLILLKPSTYMNLSGNAVRYWMQSEKIEINNVFVIVDDIALPFGTLRIRKGGSDGGHNGLKHIAQILGHQNYARLRFGIGGDFPKGFQVDYVLGRWSSDELNGMAEQLENCEKIVYSFVNVGMDRTMNSFNVKGSAKQ